MDAREFQAAMQAMGVDVTPPEAQRLLQSGDRDRSGALDFAEFAKLVLARMPSRAGAGTVVNAQTAAQIRSIKQIFDKFDQNRSGAPF